MDHTYDSPFRINLVECQSASDHTSPTEERIVLKRRIGGTKVAQVSLNLANVLSVNAMGSERVTTDDVIRIPKFGARNKVVAQTNLDTDTIKMVVESKTGEPVSRKTIQLHQRESISTIFSEKRLKTLSALSSPRKDSLKEEENFTKPNPKISERKISLETYVESPKEPENPQEPGLFSLIQNKVISTKEVKLNKRKPSRPQSCTDINAVVGGTSDTKQGFKAIKLVSSTKSPKQILPKTSISSRSCASSPNNTNIKVTAPTSKDSFTSSMSKTPIPKRGGTPRKEAEDKKEVSILAKKGRMRTNTFHFSSSSVSMDQSGSLQQTTKSPKSPFPLVIKSPTHDRLVDQMAKLASPKYISSSTKAKPSIVPQQPSTILY